MENVNEKDLPTKEEKMNQAEPNDGQEEKPESQVVVAEQEPANESPLPHAEHVLESPDTDAEEHLPVSEEHHEELEPLENFGDYSKEQLAQRMEEFSNAVEFNAVKDKVNAARDAFNHITSE